MPGYYLHTHVLKTKPSYPNMHTHTIQVHCSGGAQTKVLHFIEDGLHVIKDALFETPPLFKLIQQESGTGWKEMYQVRVFRLECGSRCCRAVCCAVPQPQLPHQPTTKRHCCAVVPSRCALNPSPPTPTTAGVQHGTPHGDLRPLPGRGRLHHPALGGARRPGAGRRYVRRLIVLCVCVLSL